MIFIHLQSMTYSFTNISFFRCDAVKFTWLIHSFPFCCFLSFIFIDTNGHTNWLICFWNGACMPSYLVDSLLFAPFFLCRFIMSDVLPIKSLVIYNNRLSLFFPLSISLRTFVVVVFDDISVVLHSNAVHRFLIGYVFDTFRTTTKFQ